MPVSLPKRIPTFHDIAERLDNAEMMRRIMCVWPPFAFSGEPLARRTTRR